MAQLKRFLDFIQKIYSIILLLLIVIKHITLSFDFDFICNIILCFFEIFMYVEIFQ